MKIEDQEFKNAYCEMSFQSVIFDPISILNVVNFSTALDENKKGKVR